jgi:hypothetical protein
MNFIKEILPILISSIISAFIAVLTIKYKFKKNYQLEEGKKNEQIRITYLHPLLITSQDLLERITDIIRRRDREMDKVQMLEWFKKIKNYNRQDKNSFATWANDEGYYAMSTLYITAVYFSYATKIRQQLPYIEVTPGDNKTLLYHIADVRISIGGKYGIWETIQDSLGSYVINKENSIYNYRQFCEDIINANDYIWFNRLIDFYCDIDKKLKEHLENIELSLKELINFLKVNMDIRKVEYCITDQSLINLKTKIPEDIFTNLKSMKDKVFRNEIDFTNALVSAIDQDCADDYKPSVLRYAEKTPISV